MLHSTSMRGRPSSERGTSSKRATRPVPSATGLQNVRGSVGGVGGEGSAENRSANGTNTRPAPLSNMPGKVYNAGSQEKGEFESADALSAEQGGQGQAGGQGSP